MNIISVQLTMINLSLLFMLRILVSNCMTLHLNEDIAIKNHFSCVAWPCLITMNQTQTNEANLLDVCLVPNYNFLSISQCFFVGAFWPKTFEPCQPIYSPLQFRMHKLRTIGRKGHCQWFIASKSLKFVFKNGWCNSDDEIMEQDRKYCLSHERRQLYF